MEEQKTLNTPLGSLTKRKRSLPIFVFWQSLPFLSIPCVCNVWKLKRGMRRQMRSKRLSDALVYRVLSFLREMTLERHSSQAWDVELGKGLTAEPWATKRSVSSSIVPWEQQKSVSTDRGVKWDGKTERGRDGKELVGWLKKNCGVRKRKKERGMKGERGLCSAAIWPVQWSRTLTLAAEEGERKGSRGAEESSVLCLKREVCLYYFNLIRSGIYARSHIHKGINSALQKIIGGFS